VTDISREAAERAAASQEGSGHGLSGGEDAISSYFSRFDMFRELTSQISTSPSQSPESFAVHSSSTNYVDM